MQAQLQLVKHVVGHTPAMHFEQAQYLAQFFSDHNIADVLELGFWHGVSTCYMAGILGKLGRGTITTIDLEVGRTQTPNVEQLLASIGERQRVQVHYEPTSYTWRLMKLLEQSPVPRFDFAYIDGPHTWFVDGFGFFLVDRLLRPGGWVLFDDLNWTHTKSATMRDLAQEWHIPVEEQVTPQVRKIWELLVKPHPNYHNFHVEQAWGWGFAQKHNCSTQSGEREIVTEHSVRVEQVGLGAALLKAARMLNRRVNRKNR